MKEINFYTAESNSLINPSIWEEHPSNPYRLTICFSKIEDKPQPLFRVYYEEYPYDYVEISYETMRKKNFIIAMGELLKELTNRVGKYYAPPKEDK